jgi:hypothetical protein
MALAPPTVLRTQGAALVPPRGRRSFLRALHEVRAAQMPARHHVNGETRRRPRLHGDRLRCSSLTSQVGSSSLPQALHDVGPVGLRGRLFADQDPVLVERVAGSEDALDAAVSALVMAEYVRPSRTFRL